MSSRPQQRGARRLARRHDEAQPIMDVNTTPLIDVMLVLLVMLIITIPIQLHAVNLDLPVARPASAAARPDKIQIDIDAQGRVLWQGTLLQADEVAQRMQALAALPVPPELHVRPHADSAYAVFASVLAASRRAGLTRVAVIGSEQFAR